VISTFKSQPTSNTKFTLLYLAYTSHLDPYCPESLFFKLITFTLTSINTTQSQGSNSRKSVSPPPDISNVLPHGPQPSTRWECPARYETNHKHQDGRPLCRYCKCWNPAPFPDGTMPIHPTRPVHKVLPTASISDQQSVHLGSHLLKASFPPDEEVLTAYSGYNLPPAPESGALNSVCTINSYN